MFTIITPSTKKAKTYLIKKGYARNEKELISKLVLETYYDFIENEQENEVLNLKYS